MRRTSMVRLAKAGWRLRPIEGGHTETLWFCLAAIMIAGYAVFDGFDPGAGIVHLFVARSEAERRSVLASVGPVWNGNEVWLLAGGGVLFFAFPAVYASGFGILSAAHNRALAPHPARHRDRVSQQGLESGVVSVVGRGVRRRKRDARDLLRRRDRQRRTRRSA